MRRIGVVSDIHGNLPALQAVVNDAGAMDGWLNLGDIVSGPLWPAETAAWLLEQSELDWLTIAGNHERQLLHSDQPAMAASDRFARERLTHEQLVWLSNLPATMNPFPGLMCVHGTPQSDLIYLLETVTHAGSRPARPDELLSRLGENSEMAPGTGLLLCGHSHVPRNLLLDGVDGLRLGNPGSVGLQAFAHDWPYRHTAETGSPHARYAVITAETSKNSGGWQLELRQVTYDHLAAARKAKAEGFDDWAHALATGCAGSSGA